MLAVQEKKCPECGSTNIVEDYERNLGEIVCHACGLVLGKRAALPQCDPSKFDGHAPDEAIVMDNNVGTVQGPERTKQVMSALNQGKATAPKGIAFENSKVTLLALWRMSGNPSDKTASEICSKTVRTIEKERQTRIPPARVDAIARACKQGIKRAELKKRLSSKEMEIAIQGIFMKEGLWPP